MSETEATLQQGTCCRESLSAQVAGVISGIRYQLLRTQILAVSRSYAVSSASSSGNDTKAKVVERSLMA